MRHRRDGRVQRRIDTHATGQMREEPAVVAQVVPGVFDLDHGDQRGLQLGCLAVQGARGCNMDMGTRVSHNPALLLRLLGLKLLRLLRITRRGILEGAILGELESASAAADAGDAESGAPTAGGLFQVALRRLALAGDATGINTYSFLLLATGLTASTRRDAGHGGLESLATGRQIRASPFVVAKSLGARVLGDPARLPGTEQLLLMGL